MPRVKPMPSLAGVRSPPIRGRPSPARMALRGKPRDNVEGRFLGGMRSARPQIRARRKPGYSIPTGWLHDKPVAKRTHAPGQANAFPRGRAEPAPPRGGSPARMALRGRPGDDAKGDFLGGARSPRPRGKAGRKARHNIIIGGKGTPGGLMGRSPGKSEVSPTGVQSPPLREGASPVRMA